MRRGARGGGDALTSHQLHLLHAAAASLGVPLSFYVEHVARSRAGMADLDASAFDMLMDAFVANGFRHPAVSLVSAAQFTALDTCRRQLGMTARGYVRLIHHITGGARRRMMTGAHFVALMAAFERCGVAEWWPEPGFVDRRKASTLRRTAWGNDVSAEDLRDLMMLFGGSTRMRGLDARAYGRVMMALFVRGGPTPAPAPQIDGEPGTTTQAQANLIWRLWHEARRGRDVSERSLDIAIARMMRFPGGLDTLTWAGARAVMDMLKASLVHPLDLSSRTFDEEPEGTWA